MTMSERLKCGWCEGLIEERQVIRGEAIYCSDRCKLAWHNQRSRETGWLLLSMVRQLWPYRPEGWKFAPGDFPGVREWRRDWNQAGRWLQGVVAQAERPGDGVE